MILDRLAQHARYLSLHPAFGRAFEVLQRADLLQLAPGRHPIDGERMFVSIDHEPGRGHDGARLEVHRRYIDIQFTLSGHEVIGWRPLARCAEWSEAFDADRDIGFFAERPETWLAVPVEHFAIFFPDDAHAPLAGSGLVKKAIVKIAC